MEQLIKVSENNGKQAVSARELHEFLESKQQFANWIQGRIKKYGLIENQDYSSFNNFIKREVGGTTQIEYALTLDCAKELAMVEGNDKGKQARCYFIACEAKLKQATKLSPAEFLLQQAQLLVAQEKRIDEVEKKVELIEAKTATRPDYFTIVGYATLHKMKVGLALASKLGRRASAICNQKGYQTEEIPDPRFGVVKMYPLGVLDEVFSVELV